MERLGHKVPIVPILHLPPYPHVLSGDPSTICPKCPNILSLPELNSKRTFIHLFLNRDGGSGRFILNSRMKRLRSVMGARLTEAQEDKVQILARS